MNHKNVFSKLTEMDLGGMALEVVKQWSSVRSETAEQFGGGQRDQVCSRKTKTARECAENKIHILQRLGADQFSETLDLAFGLKINHDARFIFSPFVQSLNELVTFRFCQQKIADGEFADIAVLKGAADILGPGFDPPFANFNYPL